MSIKINIHVKEKQLPSKTAMKRSLKHCLDYFQINAELYVDFVDADAMKELNAKHRKKNYATNVLSFPDNCLLPNNKQFLGNIILCPEVLAKESLDQKKTFSDHLTHLLLHGCLHLLGYVHEKKSDAEKMESLEIELLNQLGIDNPYE